MIGECLPLAVDFGYPGDGRVTLHQFELDTITTGREGSPGRHSRVGNGLCRPHRVSY
jgi:hypothetical protein